MAQQLLEVAKLKGFQRELIAHVGCTANSEVVLSEPTGAGKTVAITGAAAALRGVTLLICPTVVLASFMEVVED